MKFFRTIVTIFVITTISNYYCYTAKTVPINLKGKLTTLKQSLKKLKTKLNTLNTKLVTLKNNLNESHQIVFIKPNDLSTLGNDFESLVKSMQNKIIIKSITDTFDGIATSKNLNILIIAGSHGDYDAIFEPKFNIKYLKNNIVEPMKGQIKFDIIIVEACITGYVMSTFKELLKPNGTLLGTLTSTPDVLISFTIFTKIKENKPINKNLIFQAIQEKVKGQLIKSIADQKNSFTPLNFKTYTQSKGFNLSDQEISIILSSRATEDFTQPFDKFKQDKEYTGAKIQTAIKECIARIKNFIATNKAAVQSFPEEIKKYDWDSVEENFLEAVPSRTTKYKWKELNDDLLGNLRSALAMIKKSLENEPLIEFLDQNPPATLLVYSRTDDKYYYENWITTDFATKIGTYSENHKFDTVKSEFTNIQKRYNTKINKFVGIPNLQEKIRDFLKIQ